MNPASFHDLWSKYARDVYRFSLYLSGNPATAEDLTSEAFLRVWSAWDRVALPTVKSYLFAIVRNLYLQQGRRPREAPLDAQLPGGSSLAADIEKKEELRLVMEGMRQLPDVDRAALMLRVEEGMPYENIAAILQLPVATVKVKVHRARLRLAQLCQRSPIR